MEGDSKSTNALVESQLCVAMPASAVGISKHVAATKSVPSSSNPIHCFVHSFPKRLISSPFKSMMQRMRRGHAQNLLLAQYKERTTRTSRSRGFGFACNSGCEPSSSNGVSLRIARMMQGKREYGSATEFEIEASKDHWSELHPSSDEEEGNIETDLEVFKRLKEKYGHFFLNSNDKFVVGEKIAEGGQAEIFSAPSLQGEYVLKVFKERLRDLEKQWPLGMLQNRNPFFRGGLKKYYILELCWGYRESNSCYISGGTLLQNGRFAFVMKKHWGDLRKLIDFRMQHNQNRGPPFTDLEVKCILKGIAKGMEELVNHGIVHRDLKASNVLISFRSVREKPSFDPIQDIIDCRIADYECSVGIVGTGYWRAPEILRAVQDRAMQGCDIKPELFTEKSDMYSFAMTCYEVLTGCIPFENLDRNCYNLVIEGQRPKLPEHVHPLWETFLRDCWHENPLERPSFEEISRYLEKIYSQGELLADILTFLRCYRSLRKLPDRIHGYDGSTQVSRSVLPHARDLVPALLSAIPGRHWEGKEVGIGVLDQLCEDWYSAKAGKVDYNQMEQFLRELLPPFPERRQTRSVRLPPRTTQSRFKPKYNDQMEIINKPLPVRRRLRLLVRLGL